MYHNGTRTLRVRRKQARPRSPRRNGFRLKLRQLQELKKGKEKETKATAKAAKNEKKGDEKSKAKARHAREVDWPRGRVVGA